MHSMMMIVADCIFPAFTLVWSLLCTLVVFIAGERHGGGSNMGL